jgi:hypothetical protein
MDDKEVLGRINELARLGPADSLGSRSAPSRAGRERP